MDTMEESILESTKQILGLEPGDDAFNLDILTHINTAFSTLSQLGVVSAMIQGIQESWSDLDLSDDQTTMVRTYIYLKVQSYWDPPTTSYLIEARSKQIAELEWRLNINREEALTDE